MGAPPPAPPRGPPGAPPPPLPPGHGWGGWGVAGRGGGGREPRGALPSPAGGPFPGPAGGGRAFPADAASNGLNGVAARVRVHRADQEDSVRVAADSAVAVRRPAVSARSAVAADDAVDCIRGQPISARRTRHFDGDGRPGVAASAPGGGAGTPPAPPPGSARDGCDHVPLDRGVRRGHDDNPPRRAAAAAPAPRRSRVGLAVSPASSADDIN